MEENTTSAVNRRKLLRRASVVAAGVGAAGVAAAVAASPAEAASGDPVVAGSTVDAGSAGTGIANNSSFNATLSLTNPTGAALQLTPSEQFLTSDAAPGSLNATTGGDLEFQAGNGFTSEVYTSYSATQTWPVVPFRALDTRGLGGVSGNGLGLIINPSALNSNGQLKANTPLLLNLTDFVKWGWAAICNVTMQGPVNGGFVTVYQGGADRPTASSVNFLAGWPVSNCVFVALGEYSDTLTDVIQVYSSTVTHIILDVAAFIVPTLGNINPAVLPFDPNSASVQPNRASSKNANRAAKVRAYNPNR